MRCRLLPVRNDIDIDIDDDDEIFYNEMHITVS